MKLKYLLLSPIVIPVGVLLTLLHVLSVVTENMLYALNEWIEWNL